MAPKSFLFIIPRTPVNHRNSIRQDLWLLCTQALQKQSFPNWKALIIGKEPETPENDERFIIIQFEGTKEEKLQKATEYIIQNNIEGDYIIRLDDDDIINPHILKKVANKDFDIYVDKYQWFWHFESGKVSYRVWNWFPNTCIHKREHALAEWGDFADGNFQRFRKQARLIENDHSKLHPYYKNKKIVFADKQHPVYLRTITSSSVTAQNADDHNSYLKRFGIWHKNKLKDFSFLNNISLNNSKELPTLTTKELLVNIWLNYKSNKNFLKNLFTESH